MEKKLNATAECKFDRNQNILVAIITYLYQNNNKKKKTILINNEQDC